MTGLADPLAPFADRGRSVGVEIAEQGNAVTFVDADNPDAWLTADQLVEVRR